MFGRATGTVHHILTTLKLFFSFIKIHFILSKRSNSNFWKIRVFEAIHNWQCFHRIGVWIKIEAPTGKNDALQLVLLPPSFQCQKNKQKNPENRLPNILSKYDFWLKKQIFFSRFSSEMQNMKNNFNGYFFHKKTFLLFWFSPLGKILQMVRSLLEFPKVVKLELDIVAVENGWKF